MASRKERLAERKDELRTEKALTDRELGQIDGEEKDLEKYELEDLEKEVAALRARIGLPTVTTVSTEGATISTAPKGIKALIKRNFFPRRVK